MERSTLSVAQLRAGRNDISPPVSTGVNALVPAVSNAPRPGQGVALDLNGLLPSSILQTVLQLSSAASRKIAFGTGSTTFPGGSNSATNAVVTHGMGLAPVFVICSAGASGATPFVDFVIVSPITTTQFTVLIRAADGSSPVATTPANFVWAAIG